MKKVFLVIALLLLTVGCIKVKLNTKKELVQEEDCQDIVIENNSNMELVIVDGNKKIVIPSNITASISNIEEFSCYNSVCEIQAESNTKKIIINKQGQITTK